MKKLTLSIFTVFLLSIICTASVILTTPAYQQLSTPPPPASSAVISGAGTTAVNGTYTNTSTYLYEMTGYKIVGTDTGGDTTWVITDTAETLEYYTGGTLSGVLPWDADWSLGADGTNPVPTVTQE